MLGGSGADTTRKVTRLHRAITKELETTTDASLKQLYDELLDGSALDAVFRRHGLRSRRRNAFRRARSTSMLSRALQRKATTSRTRSRRGSLARTARRLRVRQAQSATKMLILGLCEPISLLAVRIADIECTANRCRSPIGSCVPAGTSSTGAPGLSTRGLDPRGLPEGSSLQPDREASATRAQCGENARERAEQRTFVCGGRMRRRDS